MIKQLGSIPFGEEYLAEDTVGHWVIENDPGQEPRMYVDEVMLGLIGLTEPLSPEENFQAWAAGIDRKYMDSVMETERLNVNGVRAEVQYPWHYPDGHTILIRCEGIRNYAYTKGVRTEGRHRDITNLISLQKEAAVISALSGDFECVNYVMLHNDSSDDVTIQFRTSEKIKAVVPGWEAESNFHDRLELAIKYATYEEDIPEFRARTRRAVVLKHLETESAYYVNSRAVVNGQIEYYQWKFTADRDQSGKLVGIVVGIHSVDDEMRQEMENREKVVKLVNERTKELRQKNEALSKVNARIIEMVGNIVESRDDDSGKHINRVKYLTRALALQVMRDLPEYGLTVEEVADIANLSPLHDVGKIMIPDSVLLKKGRLTKEEFDIMKTHCERGCKILDTMAEDWEPKLSRLSRDICLYHHEKWDGRGYPCGLKGDEIPIAAQIVSIADVYDALVSERCYKAAFSHEEACRMILAGECGQFSEKLLACFGKCRDTFRGSDAYALPAGAGSGSGKAALVSSGEYILESVPFLEKVIESMPGGFFIYQADEDEKFIYFNDMMVKYLGCSSREEFIELTGNSFKGLVHPEDYAYIKGDIDSQIVNDHLDHVVYRTVKKDGTVRWLDDYGKFIHSEDMGDVFFVFVNDFTETYIRRDIRLTEGKKTPAPADQIKGAFKDLNVMIVDDAELAREIHRELLEEQGAVVTEAINGLEAVKLIKKNVDYDLIVMDLVMPVMSGVSAIREIKKLLEETGRNIPIIGLTAEGSDMQVKEAIDAGAYECMYKPLNVATLAGIYVASIRESTARMERQLKEIRKSANTDALTRVKNIVAFTDKTAELAQKVKQNREHMFGILMCDCDDLQHINDRYGHDTGDRYICNTSAAICGIFKHSPVFRIGGDEFVVILEGVDLENVQQLAEALRARSGRSVGQAEIEDGGASFTFGMALYDSEKDGTVGDVIERADTEMHRNKLQ